MSSWTTFSQLIRRDLIAFKRGFRKKFIDTTVLFFTNVMAFGYLLQQEGAPEGYAAFFVVGAIASFGFVEIVGKVGIQLADIIKNKFNIPIIFCTSLDDRITIGKAITTQPEAYLNKPIEEKPFANAVEIAIYKEKNKALNLQKQIEFKIKDLTEKYNLTSREIDLINLLLNGDDTKTVSDKLFISTNTVKYHSKNLFEKLNVKTRAELSSIFIKIKL